MKLGCTMKKILKALEKPSTNVSYFHDMKSLESVTGLLVGSIQRAVNKLVTHELVETKSLIREAVNGKGLPCKYKLYILVGNIEIEKGLEALFKAKNEATHHE